MTERRTTTTYAVLGLLSVQPWTTYELAKQVQRSLNWFWPRAERKLYDEPKRLVEQGLATATSERTGRRPRTVYRITAKGRRALRQWLGEPPAPPALEFEGMVKVFFADAGSRDQLLTTLDRIDHEARDRMVALTTMAGTSPAPFPERVHLNALTIALSIEQEKSVLRWVDWAREQVAEWHTASETGSWDGSAALGELGAQATRFLERRGSATTIRSRS